MFVPSKEKKIVFIWFFGVYRRERNATGGFLLLARSLLYTSFAGDLSALQMIALLS